MESLEEIFKCNGGSGPVRGWGGCNYMKDYNYRNTYFQQAFREMSKAGLIDSPNACREVIECANKFFGSQQILKIQVGSRHGVEEGLVGI